MTEMASVADNRVRHLVPSALLYHCLSHVLPSRIVEKRLASLLCHCLTHVVMLSLLLFGFHSIPFHVALITKSQRHCEKLYGDMEHDHLTAEFKKESLETTAEVMIWFVSKQSFCSMFHKRA